MIMKKDLIKRTQNKRLWVSLGILAACVVGIIIVLVSTAANQRDTTVAVINGMEIDVREFRMIAEEERALVLRAFCDRYDVQPDEGFWQREFDGATPAETLQQQTLDKLAVIKVQQEMMIEYGLLKDAGYTAFFQEWVQENQHRQQAVSQDDPIYGVNTYTEKQYYQVRLDKGTLALKEKLASTILKVSAAESNQFYEQRQEAFLFDEKGNLKPFAELKNVIEKRIVDEKYEKMIAEKAQKASVHIVKKNMKRVQFN